MFKFIFVCVFSIILTCFFMQRPLSVYLETKYHTDFGFSKLENNVFSFMAIKFYERLKIFDEPKKDKSHKERQILAQEISFIDKNLTDIIKADEIKKDVNLGLEQNLTEFSPKLSEIFNIKVEKNATNPQILAPKNSNLAKLKKGDAVLFMGDSMMQPIALYMKKELSKKGVKSIDLSKHSTGLINLRYHNWAEVFDSALNDNKNVKIAMVLLGANDTYGFSIKGKYREFGDKVWLDTYASRIDEIFKIAKKANVSVLWLGLPCMKKSELNNKIKELNRLFKSAIDKNGGYFYELMPLVCNEGNYTAYMSDKKDGSVKIRADDGIHINMKGSYNVAKKLIKKVKIVDENITK